MIWISANRFGFELLQEAKKICKIDAIITLKSNSKTKMYDAIEAKQWHATGIPVYEVDNINEEIDVIKHIKTDIMIVAGWRQIISKDILDEYKIVAFHPTLLPFGRGPAPIINTILSRLETSGVTMFYMDEGVDSGDIIGQQQFVVGKDDYAIDVYNNVIITGCLLVKKYLKRVEERTSPRRKQRQAHHFSAPTSNQIFINDDIETMYSKIRAFSYPYDGAYFKKGNLKLIIDTAKLETEDGR